MTWLKDGEAVRFGPTDYPAGSAQRAVAQDAVGGTVAPVAAPSIAQILDGSPAIKRYNERLENAWRDPEPDNWNGGRK